MDRKDEIFLRVMLYSLSAIIVIFFMILINQNEELKDKNAKLSQRVKELEVCLEEFKRKDSESKKNEESIVSIPNFEEEIVVENADESKCIINPQEYANVQKYYKEYNILNDYLSSCYVEDVLQLMLIYKQKADNIGKKYAEAVPSIDYDRTIKENLDMYEEVIERYSYSYQVNEKVQEYLKVLKDNYSNRMDKELIHQLENINERCNSNKKRWNLKV